MKLRYIGMDKVYELANGAIYNIEQLFIKNNLIWVKVENNISCPYVTPQAFANNWEAV